MGSSHVTDTTCPWGWGGVTMKDLEIFAIFWLCCRQGHPCFTNTCLVYVWQAERAGNLHPIWLVNANKIIQGRTGHSLTMAYKVAVLRMDVSMMTNMPYLLTSPSPLVICNSEQIANLEYHAPVYLIWPKVGHILICCARFQIPILSPTSSKMCVRSPGRWYDSKILPANGANVLQVLSRSDL